MLFDTSVRALRQALTLVIVSTTDSCICVDGHSSSQHARPGAPIFIEARNIQQVLLKHVQPKSLRSPAVVVSTLLQAGISSPHQLAG